MCWFKRRCDVKQYFNTLADQTSDEKHSANN
jgi:hypothetical protein